jgi:hypothetical protein
VISAFHIVDIIVIIPNRRLLIALAALAVVRVYLYVLMEQDFALRPYRPGLAYKRFEWRLDRWDDERVRRTFKLVICMP